MSKLAFLRIIWLLLSVTLTVSMIAWASYDRFSKQAMGFWGYNCSAVLCGVGIAGFIIYLFVGIS